MGTHTEEGAEAMSEDTQKDTAAATGDPLTEEELEAVVGGSNFTDLNPNNPDGGNPPPAPDAPAFPGSISN